jgi:hypothetical protein
MKIVFNLRRYGRLHKASFETLCDEGLKDVSIEFVQAICDQLKEEEIKVCF